MMMALLLWLQVAQAGSLDLLEVGGLWGTPGATNPTAVWWNPAGLAGAEGTQLLVEVAPTFATVGYDRVAPAYGPPESGLALGGPDRLGFRGTVPFLGVSSDLGIDDLGVGLGLAVPFARGGLQDPEPGPGRYHLREGNIQAVYAMAGAAWTFFDVVSVGLSAAFVDSTWSARTDVETATGLRDGLAAQGMANHYCEDDDLGPCDDAVLEDPDYAATLQFDQLKARRFTFGAGVRVQPTEQVAVSLSYQHGMHLAHNGDVHMTFGCPPDTDILGRIGAELGGLCDQQVRGDGTVGYRLPSRLNLGVVLQPTDRIRAEIMGGWVGWKAFRDYEIQTRVEPSQFHDRICDDGGCTDAQAKRAEESSHLVSQDRLWARDNRNSLWVGADGKVDVNRYLMVGGRVLYDRSAIPSRVLSTNNYDADSVSLGALVFVRPVEQLGVGLSVGHQLLASRTVTDSAFGVTMARSEALEDRYFYPSANGTYTGSITRIGISLRGQLPGGL